MDLFSITCTTCKSRLKVREATAIGQILACPKCGGMVMVKPPPGWEPDATGAPAAARSEQSDEITAIVESRRAGDTLSASHFDAVDDLLSDAPPKPKPATVSVAQNAAGLARPRFAGTPPPGAAPPATVPAPPQPAAAASPPRPVAVADEPPEPAIAARKWGEPYTRRLVWVAVSVVAGGSLAIAAVAAISAMRSDPKPAALVPKPAANTAPRPDSTPAESQPPESQPAGDGAAEQPATQDPVAKLQAPTEPAPASTPPEPVPATHAPPVADSDPHGLVSQEPATAKAKPPAANPLTPFDQILSGATEDPLAQRADPAAAPPPDEGSPAPLPRPELPRPELPRPAPRVVDVAARLADPLPGIETDGTPLADFLQVMSELSTIPITLEPDALPLAQASATSPVNVKLSNTTTGKALAAGLASLGLEFVVEGDQLVARLIEPTPPRTQVYPLKDLSGGDAAEAADLAEAIQALVDPESWKEESAGELTVTPDALTIRQRRAVHARLFILCEKLRTARQLPYASRFDPALFKLDTRLQRAASRLATPLTLNFSQPTPLVQILPRLEEASGMRILVDWRDIAAAGWNPDGEATLVVEKQPLSAALTALLEPMDLAWRAVDGQTVQVLTRETLLRLPDLEFYPVADLLAGDPAGDTLLSQVRQALGPDKFLGEGGPFEVRLDAPGKCLLASLPQPQQQELAALLASLRSAEK